jgi:hypothetical protein
VERYGAKPRRGSRGTFASKKMKKDREYLGKVNLIIIGDDFDPDSVSNELSLRPSQSWRKGEQHELILRDGTKRVFKSRHRRGGWKLFIDPKRKHSPIEKQLKFWCDKLKSKTEAIAKLKVNGMRCALNLFILTDGTATIRIPEELQKSVASIGLDMELDIWVGNKSEQAGGTLRR